MEQRAMIRFFTLKGLKIRAIHTEFESVYGSRQLTLPTMKKWGCTFTKGERIYLTMPGPEGP
jgi:hypothetical protein